MNIPPPDFWEMLTHMECAQSSTVSSSLLGFPLYWCLEHQASNSSQDRESQAAQPKHHHKNNNCGSGFLSLFHIKQLHLLCPKRVATWTHYSWLPITLLCCAFSNITLEKSDGNIKIWEGKKNLLIHKNTLGSLEVVFELCEKELMCKHMY